VTNARTAELLEADVRLAGQIRELARAYRTIAHELRAPLSAMLVNVELLRESLEQQLFGDRPAREKQLGYVSILKQELTRLSQSLHGLLTEAGSRVQRQEPFDLRALISDLASLVGPQARRQGVDVTTGLPVEAPIVLGHADRLKEAFLNIVVNSLQAMPDGGKLIMHLEVLETGARVLFRDTGPGIRPEIAERIFDLPGSTKADGSGIGLRLARGLVELNGGELRVHAGHGHGATIQIDLPLAPSGF
jgi:signal transduction histidine kinase